MEKWFSSCSDFNSVPDKIEDSMLKTIFHANNKMQQNIYDCAWLEIADVSSFKREENKKQLLLYFSTKVL